jgi:hypothetical protein
MLTNRIVATIASPWPDRSSLEGRTLHFKAALNLPDQRVFQSEEQLWQAPQMSVPSFDGKCDADELKAALQIDQPTAGWLTIVRPLLVFVGFATLLFVLWFWLPRLIWPEQYLGTFTTQGSGMRWSDKTQLGAVSKQRPTRPAPPGFETGSSGGSPHARPWTVPSSSRTFPRAVYKKDLATKTLRDLLAVSRSLAAPNPQKTV